MDIPTHSYFVIACSLVVLAIFGWFDMVPRIEALEARLLKLESRVCARIRAGLLSESPPSTLACQEEQEESTKSE